MTDRDAIRAAIDAELRRQAKGHDVYQKRERWFLYASDLDPAGFPPYDISEAVGASDTWGVDLDALAAAVESAIRKPEGVKWSMNPVDAMMPHLKSISTRTGFSLNHEALAQWRSYCEGTADILSEAVRKRAAMLEELLRKAVTAEIGEGWSLSDLEGRVCGRRTHRPNGTTEEVYMLDGLPILRVESFEQDTAAVMDAGFRYAFLGKAAKA